MQIDLRVPPFAPIPEVAAFARRCEEAGFDGVGFIDSQMVTRDVFVAIAAAAMATSRIRLMPAVTNPLTRHVSVLASTALSLEDLAPGRVEIWMGRGFSSLNLVGLPYASVQQMRETVVGYRRLLAGEWDVFPSVHTHLNDAHPVPIYLTGSGPKVIQLAGEVADGVVVSVGLQPDALARARHLVEQGARRGKRDPSEVEIIVCALTVIRESRDEAYAWASPLCAQRLSNTAWLKANGIDAHELATPDEFAQLYPDPFHAEDWARAMELSAFIPRDLRAEMCDAIGIIGTPADCLRRLQALAAGGFQHVFLQTAGTMNFPETEVSLFRENIATALGTGPLARAL
jgi:5,10-methylenetetrahydromethanopterin reductase